jgi:hypothetical protein
MHPLIQKLISSIGAEATNSAEKILDTLTTTDSEKANAKLLLTNTILQALQKIALYQQEVLLAEIQGNWLQRSWRPIIMLAFGSIVCIGAFKDIDYLKDTSRFWDLLELGLGGYVIGRTTEKVVESITKNIDLLSLRKRDRKDTILR